MQGKFPNPSYYLTSSIDNSINISDFDILSSWLKTYFLRNLLSQMLSIYKLYFHVPSLSSQSCLQFDLNNS